jgi:predicted  nucleic acid-binding Zn-ribbon protein
MTSRAPINLPESVQPDAGLEVRVRKVEEELAAIRSDIAAAIAGQEQLQAQLRPTLEKLSELLRQRSLPGSSVPSNSDDAVKNFDQKAARLESRLRGVEQRLERVAGQVAGILDSRIWRTLMKGGGFLMRFRR